MRSNVPPPRPAAPARPLRAMEPAPAPQAPAVSEERGAPSVPAGAAKPKADVDPLYADIEKKLGEALARPTAASAPAPRSAPPAAPAARREPVMEPPAPAPTAKEPKSHLDALEEEMASLLGRERPS